MKTIVIVLSCIVACCLAAPQGPRDPNEVKLVRYEFDPQLDEEGGYQFKYALSDGQIRSELGYLDDVGEQRVIVMRGAYSFVGPDGIIYWVNYTADENGFHPVVGTGPEGGVQLDEAQGIDPNALKSLVG